MYGTHSFAKRRNDRRDTLVCPGSKAQHADQHYSHVFRDCEEIEIGVVPANDHFDNRRKHESEGGTADCTDQGYKEAQLRYCLCHDN